MKTRQAEIQLILYASKVNKNGEYLIAYKATFSGIRKIKSAGYYCSKDNWDDKNGRVKPKYPNSVTVNRNIQEKLMRYQQRLNNWNYTGTAYNAVKLLSDFAEESTLSNAKKLDFFKLIEKYGESVERYNSKKSYSKLTSKLTKFMDGKHLLVTDIDFKFHDAFGKFVKKSCKSDSTVRSYFKYLRAVLNKAVYDGLCQYVPYKYCDIYNNIKKKISLSSSQFAVLYNYATFLSDSSSKIRNQNLPYLNYLNHLNEYKIKLAKQTKRPDWWNAEDYVEEYLEETRNDDLEIEDASEVVFNADKRYFCALEKIGSPEFAITIFILAFYFQGMALVDMAKIKSSDLDIDKSDGQVDKKYFIYRSARSKTNQPFSIAIRSDMFIERVLNHYIQTSTIRSGFLFPILNDKYETEKRVMTRIKTVTLRININIRSVVKMLNLANQESKNHIKLPEDITYYIVRHTYALIKYKQTNDQNKVAILTGRSKQGIDTYLEELVQLDEIKEAANNLF